jgi:hypothetical protein
MDDEERSAIAKAMREARQKARGYADFWGWRTNRDLEEYGVIQSLCDSMEVDASLKYFDVIVRGRGKDPPDCEAIDESGLRVAIEITELVDEAAIHAYKAGRLYDWAAWTREDFVSAVNCLIHTKDGKCTELKDAPYEGGYHLVIFTDEPMLPRTRVEEIVTSQAFDRPKHIARVLLLLSYDPAVERCPYFVLRTDA